MAPPKAQQGAKHRGGVALGMLGLMLMVFFAIVFMLAKPIYWKLYDATHHWDPHPDGVVRHHDGAITGNKTLVAAKDLVKGSEDGKQAVAGGSTSSSTPAGGKDAVVPEGKKEDPAKQPDKGKEVPAAEVGKDKPATKVEEKPVEQPAKKVEEKPANKAEEKPANKAEEKPAKKVEEKVAEGKPAKGADQVAVVNKGGKDAANEDEGITQLDKDYRPTREMVQKIAQDGYLVVTWANYHYYDFVKTWAYHIQKVGVTGYIIGAMDDHLLRELIAHKWNCFSMKSGLTLGDFGWGSATFAKMGREKIRLISVFLKLDVQVIIADVDVMFLRNPIPYFQRYPEADVLTSSDHLSNTVPDESLERWPHVGSAANIGIMLFRNNSMAFVEHWIDVIEKDEKIWDQNAFNDLFRDGAKVIENDPKHYFMGYRGTVKMGVLPVSIFCSGHTFFVQRLAQRLKLEVYAVHATFQFSGTPGKRHRYREFMLWDDPPEYYDHESGFVSFTMDGVEPLLKGAGPLTGGFDLGNVQGHFKLVNHQLTRIRNALAISSLLGRALVIPQLWCGLDRWWAPHTGVIPGSSFDVPFQCPLDHVVDLENGVFRHFPEHEFGKRIDIREYSFFNNSKMTPAVRDSRVTVQLCTPGDTACSDGSKPAPVEDAPGGGKVVRVQAGLMSAQLRTALQEANRFKVLDFSTMQNAFRNFTDPVEWKHFFNRIQQYGSIWCCILAHPGHIHYDWWWDTPHQDKFGRHWNGTWEPKCGP